MPRFKVADVVFDAVLNYGYTKEESKNYLYTGDEEPEFTAVVSLEDIKAEKEKAPDFPDFYLESLALFRKLCDYILDKKQGIIFHSSAIMVDGNAYLFTAPSGTGKSTHTRLWRELLGDRAVMINDDKPIIRYIDGEFYVYGTPWNGKHQLDTNTRAKIKGICQIYQAKENVIEKVSPSDMLMTVLNQTIRPTEVDKFDKLIDLIDKLLSKVDLYKLGCNISLDAARLAFETMSKEIGK
jgi:hypothetical protein